MSGFDWITDWTRINTLLAVKISMGNALVAFKGNNLSPPMSLNRGIQPYLLKVFMKNDGFYFLDIERLVDLNITKAVAPDLYESPSSSVSNITKPKSEPSSLIAALGDKIAPVLAILDSGADDSWLGSNIPDELVHSKSDGCALKAVVMQKFLFLTLQGLSMLIFIFLVFL